MYAEQTKTEKQQIAARIKTLLVAMITGLCACGISFCGFYFGRTSVQLVDVFKRLTEVSSVITAFFISLRYRNDQGRLKMAELFSSRIVSVIMLISAILLGAVTFLKFKTNQGHGNVLIGMVISCGDITMNSLFYFRYHKLGKTMNSKLVVSQKNFYFMKVLSNWTVLISLILLFIMQRQRYDRLVDTAAAVILIIISISISICNLIKTQK